MVWGDTVHRGEEMWQQEDAEAACSHSSGPGSREKWMLALSCLSPFALLIQPGTTLPQNDAAHVHGRCSPSVNFQDTPKADPKVCLSRHFLIQPRWQSKLTTARLPLVDLTPKHIPLDNHSTPKVLCLSNNAKYNQSNFRSPHSLVGPALFKSPKSLRRLKQSPNCTSPNNPDEQQQNIPSYILPTHNGIK